MSIPLLVESYLKLPQPRPGDDPDLLDAGIQDSMQEFCQTIQEKYTEGTLQRLLQSPDATNRRAAALALGFVGTMRSNQLMAAALRDKDKQARRIAADSLWEIWFRGGTKEQNNKLREAANLPDLAQTLAALDDLIRVAPEFAEVYNQRAVLFFRRSEFARCVTDCETTLRLNPFHFGAASGMGQCYLRMNKPRAALRAFRQALEINPDLPDLKKTIREIEAALGDSRE